MSEPHKSSVIFESDVFSISEFRCACKYLHKTGEEAAPGHEIVFPQKGFFKRRNALGKTQADPGLVLFFNKDQPYEIEHPLGGGDVCSVFSMSPSVLRDLVGQRDQETIFLETMPFKINHQRIDLTTSLRHQLVLKRAANLPKENNFGFEEETLGFLGSLFEKTSNSRSGAISKNKTATREAHKALVERTILYLNKNFSKIFSISELAKAVFSSPFHLSRVFKKEAGIPLHAYISGLRLRAALNGLRETKGPITELALDLGFSSHSHFSSAFKRAFSLSPKAYRNL